MFHFSLPWALCKLTTLPFLNTKIYQTFWGGKISTKEQLFLWEQIQISNVFLITNSGIAQDLSLV
jgi:hypothetical protein